MGNGLIRGCLILISLAAPSMLFATGPGEIHCGSFQRLGKRALDPHPFELGAEQRKELAQEYRGFIEHWRKESTPSQLAQLERHLAPVDFARLKSLLSSDHHRVVARSDLAILCGYLDFLESKGISTEKFPLEIHVEKSDGGQKAYFLTDIDHSLVGDPEGKTIAWTHDDEWAHQRFLDNHSGTYVLGQTIGTSKFATLGSFPPHLTKKEMLNKLGLVGYPKFDKPGPFYLVSVDMTKNRVAELSPKIPIIYKWTDDAGNFVMASHFDEDSVPGFTSGGLSEVVIPTFTAKAKNLTDLAKEGIRLQVHSDDP